MCRTECKIIFFVACRGAMAFSTLMTGERSGEVFGPVALLLVNLDDKAHESSDRSSPTRHELELVRAYQRGEPQAGAALYAHLEPIGRGTIRRILGGRDPDVDDVTQIALVQVFSGIGSFRAEGSLKGWASTICAHAAFRQLKKRGLERRLFCPWSEQALEQAGRDEPRDRRAREAVKQLSACLQDMDPVKAWAYVLHDVHGHTLSEVAKIMECTEAAAQTRLVRGRQELHDKIEKRRDLAGELNALAGTAFGAGPANGSV
jgi:RNA polymerase sigma-70 factor, ECF subfamily